MNAKKQIKRLQVKVHVTPDEKATLVKLKSEAGMSLSNYLLTAGMGRQTGVAAERNKDHVDLLEMAISRLNLISENTADGSADSLMVLEQLCVLERHIIMLAPSTAVRKPPEC